MSCIKPGLAVQPDVQSDAQPDVRPSWAPRIGVLATGAAMVIGMGIVAAPSASASATYTLDPTNVCREVVSDGVNFGFSWRGGIGCWELEFFGAKPMPGVNVPAYCRTKYGSKAVARFGLGLVSYDGRWRCIVG